jgi:perosamine synthetase
MTARSRIPVAGPDITEDDIALVAEAARGDWYEKYNRHIDAFEKTTASFCGVKHAISVPCATHALHLAFATLGIKEGDEVIAPDVTWIASVAPIYQTGADAVLVDITPDTWCIDPAAVERAITPRTKAIMGVDLYGSMCDWNALRAIADKHGLALVEDAAESLGSRYDNRAAGALGDFAILSFHGSKLVTCGEGGMLLTDNTELYKRALFLRDHGRHSVAGRYQMFYNTEIAFKYKMSAVQAALGLGQMRRIDALVERKRKVFEWYSERLSGMPGVSINVEPGDVYNCYWMPTIVLDPALGLTKYDLMEAFDKRGVDTRPFFTPLSSMPAFDGRDGARRHANPVSERISTHAINLPSGNKTSKEDVDYVCSCLSEILARREKAA